MVQSETKHHIRVKMQYHIDVFLAEMLPLFFYAPVPGNAERLLLESSRGRSRSSTLHSLATRRSLKGRLSLFCCPTNIRIPRISCRLQHTFLSYVG